LPIYIGVPNDVLVHDLIGQSLVLAFSPGDGTSPPSGVIACRPATEETLVTVVERLSMPIPNRVIDRQEHRGVAFVSRREIGSRRTFLLRIGKVVFLSDKEDVIRSIIDTSLGEKSLYDSPLFQDIRSSIGEGAVLQLLINPRPFDPLVASAVTLTKGIERHFSELFANVWRELDWAGVSIRAQDHLQLSVHVSAPQGRLSEDHRRWLEHFEKSSSFWSRVPADALFAAASELDARDIGKQLLQIAEFSPELHSVVKVFQELAHGEKILPLLGPEIQSIIEISLEGELQLVVEAQMRDLDTTIPSGLTVRQNIEWAMLRPMLVFYSTEHNIEFQDATRIETLTVDDLTFHAVAGSKRLPAELTPGFAIGKDRIYMASSPKALAQHLKTPSSTWDGSTHHARMRSAVGEAAVMKAVVNLQKLREYLVQRRGDIADGIARETAVSADNAGSRLDDLASLLDLVDFATLTVQHNEPVHVLSISLFPATASGK
jgi:hypothetical protein